MSGTNIRLRLTALILLPLGVSACSPATEDAADDVWQPKGINAANLAVMVENPADLNAGRHDPGPDRKLGARAVTDLWANPVTPLVRDAATAGGSGSSGSGSSGSGSSGGSSGGAGSSGGGSSGGGSGS